MPQMSRLTKIILSVILFIIIILVIVFMLKGKTGDKEKKINSGIDGKVVCLEKGQSESPCLGKAIVKDSNQTRITEGQSDSSGNLKIPIEPGKYFLQIADTKPELKFKNVNPTDIIVVENQYTSVKITYWDGK